MVVASPVLRPDAEATPNRLGATLVDLRAAMEEAVRAPPRRRRRQHRARARRRGDHRRRSSPTASTPATPATPAWPRCSALAVAALPRPRARAWRRRGLNGGRVAVGRAGGDGHRLPGVAPRGVLRPVRAGARPGHVQGHRPRGVHHLDRGGLVAAPPRRQDLHAGARPHRRRARRRAPASSTSSTTPGR